MFFLVNTPKQVKHSMKTTLDCTIIKRWRQFRHPSNHVQPVKVTFDRVENMHRTYIGPYTIVLRL